MPIIRLILLLAILPLLPVLASEKPRPTEAEKLRQWMTENHLTRAIAYSAPSFWGFTVLYLGETEPHSPTVQFYLYEYYDPEGEPTILRGTITHGPQVERLFTRKVYTLSKEIKGMPQDDSRARVADSMSYFFTKIENGHAQSSFRDGEDQEYFEPIVDQQASAAFQLIEAIHKAKKKH